MEGLTYVHSSSGEGVRDVSFSLRRGDFTVVTGTVGSGKTTLLRALVGWLPPQSGAVRWNGSVVEDGGRVLAPPRCAYLSQVPSLFSERLRTNILVGLPEERVDLSGAVRSAVLEQDVDELEDGLDTLVGPRGVKLSGGQQRRSGAARSFVREPDLLVMDDVSNGLDVETEQTLWERLSERGDRTALVASHRRPGVRAGRPHHRAEGRTRRVPGQAGLPPRDLGGDAPAVGRRCRQPVRGGPPMSSRKGRADVQDFVVEQHPDADVFLGRSQEFLMRDEAENVLMLGLAARRPEDALFLTVERNQELVMTALQSGRNLIVSRGPESAIDALVYRLTADGISNCLGVTGSGGGRGSVLGPLVCSHGSGRPSSHEYAPVPDQPRWSAPARPVRCVQAGVRIGHSLCWRSGTRPSTSRRGSKPQGRARRSSRGRSAEGRMYLWEDGVPVAMAGWGGPTPGGARIGYVYTPPEHRGRGYASACVADLSQLAPRPRAPLLRAVCRSRQPRLEPYLRANGVQAGERLRRVRLC